MTKADYELLSRIFDAETRGGIYQRKSNRIETLEREGFLMRIDREEPAFGGLMMRVQGWRLTGYGHIMFCGECARRETETP